jgi:formylglycine-generating enzyme required for sulfatase activity
LCWNYRKGEKCWIEYWDLASGESVRRVPFGEMNPITAFIESGKRVVEIDVEKRIHVYDLPTCTEVFRSDALPPCDACFISDDGRMLAYRVGGEVSLYRLPDLLGGSKAKSILEKDEKESDNAKPTLDPNAPPPAIAPFDALQAKRHQEAWAKHLGTDMEITNTIGMKLRLIPPGEFTMGSTQEEIDELLQAINDAPSEGPQHRVKLAQPFYLGSYEVTQQQYQELMGVNPSHFSPTGPRKDAVKYLVTGQRPVDSVNWFDAIDFCNKLSDREQLSPYYVRVGEVVKISGGTGYRLPTEAEWEFACRAGTTTWWSWSDDETSIAQHAWFNWNGNGRTQRVGELRANPFGLYDLHGNVWEWCWDWKGDYATDTVTDPSGPFVGSARVLRSGAFVCSASECRSAMRGDHAPMYRHVTYGFRVTRSVGSCNDSSTAAVERDSLGEDSKWAEQTQHLPFVISYEQGLAEAKAKNKPLMFFVTTTSCGWCKKHAQENFNDDTVKSLLDNFVLVIVDGDTEPEALAALDAKRGFPLLIFQSAAGEKLAEQVGYAPVDVFTKVIEDALAKAGSATTDDLPTPPEDTDEKEE